jgi:hypothetical protein
MVVKRKERASAAAIFTPNWLSLRFLLAVLRLGEFLSRFCRMLLPGSFSLPENAFCLIFAQYFYLGET